MIRADVISGYQVKRPSNLEHLKHSNGKTKDIIAAILEADKLAPSYTMEAAPQFLGASDLETCRNIWTALRNQVKYLEDPDGRQVIKSPGALWYSKKGDCKSLSVFIASVLANLGIPYSYRFISQNRLDPFHHVYIIANPDSQPIYIDAVLDRFNYQEPYKKKKDYMTRISYISGIKGQRSAIHGTAEPKPFNTWKDQKWMPPFCIKPGQINAYFDSKLKTEDVINTGPLCLYLYWDERRAPFPSRLEDKRTKARQVKAALQQVFKEECLEAALQYGIFKAYGKPVNEVLERLYNIENYGNPGGPVPTGIPFLNLKTRAWDPNGLDLTNPQQNNLFIAVIFSEPYNNLWPPAGIPYWSNYGVINLNGVRQKGNKVKPRGSMRWIPKSQFLKQWEQKNPIPQSLLNAYNGRNPQRDPAAVAYAENVFSIVGKVRKDLSITPGELSQIRTPRVSGAKIGLAFTAIAGIIAGVLAAIAGIAKAAKEIINAFKGVKAENVPNPSADFMVSYESTVGPVYTDTNGALMWQDPETGAWYDVSSNPPDPVSDSQESGGLKKLLGPLAVTATGFYLFG